MPKKITEAGLLTGLALLLSYIESLFPFQAGIPGFKLGLANLVIVIALYFLKPGEVFLISLLRFLGTGFFSGNLISFLFSFIGGLCSFIVMLLCFRSRLFSPAGLSIAGGTAHNLAQLAAAALLLNLKSLLWYTPVLLFAGITTGLGIGLIAGYLIPALQTYKNSDKQLM